MVHVIVMVMRYDDDIDNWDVLDLAGNLRVAFRAKPSEWAATLAEDWIEEYAEALGKFYKVAGVA